MSEDVKNEESMSLLQKIWSRGAKVIEEVKLKRSTKVLRGKAELDIIKYDTDKEVALKAFEDAIDSAKEDPNFDAIVAARVQLKKAEKMYDVALETYKELFGDEPRLG